MSSSPPQDKPPARIMVKCPCGAHWDVERQLAGHYDQCPQCASVVEIPDPFTSDLTAKRSERPGLRHYLRALLPSKPARRLAPYQWLALGAGVFLVGLVLILLARAPATPPKTAPLPDRFIEEILAETRRNLAIAEALEPIDPFLRNNSNRWHWRRLSGLASNMRDLMYDVTSDRMGYRIVGTSSSTWPCEVMWLLEGMGSAAPNDVPVSWLKLDHAGPFTHDMAVAAINEFRRVDPAVEISKITKLMLQAEVIFQRLIGKSHYGRHPYHAQSPVSNYAHTDSPLGEYVFRVDIKQWPRQEYLSEEGSSEVLIYFVYIPPDREIMLWEIPDLADWVASD